MCIYAIDQKHKIAWLLGSIFKALKSCKESKKNSILTYMHTVSVIIPAYNEELTIESILKDILNQDRFHYILKKIIVITDGCSDATARVAASVSSPLIEIIEHTTRKGKPFRINEITATITTDIIIHIDADTKLGSKGVLDDMVKPFYTAENLGLVCGDHQPLSPHNFVQKVAVTGLKMFRDLKNDLGEKSICYRCNGRLLAFKTKAARAISIPHNVSDDMYIFYAIISLGYTVEYCQKAITYYLAPDNLRDYIVQQIRYKKDNIRPYFPQLYWKFQTITFYKKASLCVRSIITRRYPTHIILLLIIIYTFISFIALFERKKYVWAISPSTKKTISSYAN